MHSEWYRVPQETIDAIRATRERGGRVLAVGTTTLRALETAAAEGLPIYLRLLHATIADAISWGCKSLSLGRTALEPKAALGAKPEPMSVWLRHRVPAMNWIVRGMLGAVTHDEAPERNPFKAEQQATK